ncbi:hypothetical protein HanIR_Chr13g0640891 [Helianthus annuus]|nr:hypothetical protein HanIR_Chr13g0640891 [Helianthus annuus]KAJ0497756.1 hypothetical protein HanHA89_Chr13g0514791 [Helianthus annuus]
MLLFSTKKKKKKNRTLPTPSDRAAVDFLPPLEELFQSIELIGV